MSKPPFSQRDGQDFAELTKEKFFIGSDAGSQYLRRLSPKQVEVFPSIFGTDRLFIDFKRTLQKRLSEHPDLQKKVTNKVFGPNAITSDFSRLLTVPGVPMIPATYAVINNTLLRDEMGLSRDFKSERHKQIFHKFITLRYGGKTDSRAKFSRVSSSGFPFFTNNVSFKAQHLSFFLSQGERVKKCIDEGNLKDLYSFSQIILANYDVYRLQADSLKIEHDTVIPKTRLVNDYEFAISGGATGKRFPASKQVLANGAQIKNVSAARARTANGFCIVPNASLSAAFEPFRDYADTTFKFTYKHTTRDAILSKIKKFKSYFPVDVTQYDQSVADWMVKEWLEVSPFNETGRKLIWLMFNAPMFYRGVHKDDKPTWTGDPLDVDYYNQFRGLPSGAFCTSAMGKDFFTWACLCLFDDFAHNVLEDMESILLGEHPMFGLLNQGDRKSVV